MEAATFNFNIKKIHDTVWVFKNAIENPQDFVEYFESKDEWKDWYTFGKQLEGPNFSVSFDQFPTPADWEGRKDNNSGEFSKSLHFENKINDLFFNATKLYVEENNLDIDNWTYTGWNVAKYRANSENEYVMVHHTDYQREYTHNPGTKFVVTAVFYLNDNYTGGEVAFRFLDDNDVSIIKEAIPETSEPLDNKLPKVILAFSLSVFETSKSEIICFSSFRFNFFISSINLFILFSL